MLIRVVATLCLLAVIGSLAEWEEECEELRNCTQTLENLDFSQGVPLTNLDSPNSDSDAIDAVCQEVQAAHTCVDDTLQACPSRSGRGLALSILEIGDYICDDDNRDDMEELLESDCITNQTVQADLNSDLEGCLMIFVRRVTNVSMTHYRNRHRNPTPDNSDYCPHLHGLGNCMVNVATDQCGQEAGDFAGHVWAIALRHMMPKEFENCTIAVQTTRRALEQLMPDVAKRHFSAWDGWLGDWF